ncbi:hypothetical protein BH23GEM6_BH23GEM6_01490 [soil metagenome]
MRTGAWMEEIGTGRGSAAPWAAAAPLLCAVHCVATPVLLVIAPAIAVNQTLEYLMMGAAALISVAVGLSGFRHHGEALIWVPIIAGLALWALGSMSTTGFEERLLTASGGILLAAGLIWSARLLHRTRCRSCGG